MAAENERTDTSESIVSARRDSRSARAVRRFVLAKHGVLNWLRTPGLKARVLQTGIKFWLVAYPVFALGWKRSLVYTVIWVAVGLWTAYDELSPRHMKLVLRNYTKRKFELYNMLQRLQFGSKSKDAVYRFQCDALQLIASYVRDHRHDLHGETIFANLLVDDGDALVVVARDRDHDARSIGARYPRDLSMLAWNTVLTGASQCTGDVRVEYPGTADDKPYRSILTVPVKVGNDTVGVVSIDSSRTYHFDSEFEDLVTALKPYVSLLSWTLIRKSTNTLSTRGRSSDASGGQT